THSYDIAGGPTDHSPCFLANSKNTFRLAFNRDDGRFVKDDAASLDVDENVGRPQINTDIFAKHPVILLTTFPHASSGTVQPLHHIKHINYKNIRCGKAKSSFGSRES